MAGRGTHRQLQELAPSFAIAGNSSKQATATTSGSNGPLAKTCYPRAATRDSKTSWQLGVLQKTQGRKRKYDETKADSVAKVVEETHRLKPMRHEFVEPIPHGSDTNTRARFSAIQASLQHRSRGRLLQSCISSSVAQPADHLSTKTPCYA